MGKINISAANIANITAALDKCGTELSVEEQGLVAGVLQAAGNTLHDVTGYAFSPTSTTVSLGGVFAGVLTGPSGVVAGAAVGGTEAVVAAGPGAGNTGVGLTIPGLGGAVFVV